MKFISLLSLTLILLNFSSTLGGTEEDLAKEIIDVQEKLLSATKPRPIGEDIKNSIMYPELVRRVALLNKNWIHQQKGITEAAKHQLTVIELPNASDVEKAYMTFLKNELGIKVIPLPDGMKGVPAIFYAYGFNSKQ
ncbi:hypothetical protein OAB00_00580, partial [Akkermansiaceae bacterium]|nr:hypothetical protein [Akkermansiaceae bacterium]